MKKQFTFKGFKGNNDMKFTVAMDEVNGDFRLSMAQSAKVVAFAAQNGFTRMSELVIFTVDTRTSGYTSAYLNGLSGDRDDMDRVRMHIYKMATTGQMIIF